MCARTAKHMYLWQFLFRIAHYQKFAPSTPDPTVVIATHHMHAQHTHCTARKSLVDRNGMITKEMIGCVEPRSLERLCAFRIGEKEMNEKRRIISKWGNNNSYNFFFVSFLLCSFDFVNITARVFLLPPLFVASHFGGFEAHIGPFWLPRARARSQSNRRNKIKTWLKLYLSEYYLFE